jgi:hypothetical protein
MKSIFVTFAAPYTSFSIAVVPQQNEEMNDERFTYVYRTFDKLSTWGMTSE